MPKHAKYQDYVIKNGKLIGEFEEMYKDFDDPWEQTTREAHAIEKKVGIELLKRDNRKRPVEYGCGLGHYTEDLRSNLGAAIGIDISETAVTKAKQHYPKCDFIACDVLDFHAVEKLAPDAILLIEISWYILEKLERFKKHLSGIYGGKDISFFHTLMTYAPGLQKYGTNFFTNLPEIMNYWSDVIEISDWGEISRKEYDGGKRTFFYGKIK